MVEVGNVLASDVELANSKETKAASTDIMEATPVTAVTRTETVVEGCESEQCSSDSKKLLQLVPYTTTSVSEEVDVASPKIHVFSLQSGSEGSRPYIREKVMKNGYNWRKYGHKLVNGNEFVSSYYRCTRVARTLHSVYMLRI